MSPNKTDFLNTKRFNIDLNLYTCGHEYCPNNLRIGPVSRYHYIIHYVLKGKGTFEVNGITYTLGQNQGFLIEPDVLTTYASDEDDPWEYMWVGFVGSKAKDYLTRANLSSNTPIFTYKNGDTLERCIFEMIEVVSRDTNKDLLLISKLYEFMYLLTENYTTHYAHDTLYVSSQSYIEQAMLYCETNYSNGITVQDIANHVNLDRSYLNKLFQQSINKSPKQYLMELRMAKASELLLETSMDIYSISRAVGYDNQFQFSTIFKKYKAVPPTEYRRQVPTEWFLIDHSND